MCCHVYLTYIQFQPITSAFSLLGEYDIILGMAFSQYSYSHSPVLVYNILTCFL